MKNIFSLIIIALVFHLNSFSQTLTLETDNTGLQCHYMFIDITASGFPANVAAISLYINVDGNVVQYVSSQQTGSINGALLNQLGYNQIGLTWSNPSGEDINGNLLTLILHYDGGSSVLDWDQIYSSIALSDLTPITVSYVDGGVSEGSYTFNTYYVDAARPSSGNGLSWATAKKTITEVANLSLKPGEKVYIKSVVYNE